MQLLLKMTVVSSNVATLQKKEKVVWPNQLCQAMAYQAISPPPLWAVALYC